jgi:hypothetical protein
MMGWQNTRPVAPRENQPPLALRAAQPGFTPGRRDISPLLDLLLELAADQDSQMRAAERALARRADLALPAALERLAVAPDPRARARLLRLAARLAGVPADGGQISAPADGATADSATADGAPEHAPADGAPEHAPADSAPASAPADSAPAHSAPADGATADTAPAVARAAVASAAVAALTDGDARVRRQAALALARIRAAGAEDALLAAWQAEPELTVRRALASALGIVGGERALAALRSAEPDASDPELRRLVERAILTASRTLERGHASSIDASAAPPAPMPVLLRCRAGLERLLAAELVAGGWPVAAIASARVETVLGGPLASLFGLRLHHGVGFPLPARAGPAVHAVVDALDSPEASAMLAAFTRGPVRFRVDWQRGGHRRGEVWRIAGAIAARRPDLVNDPTDSTWHVHVIEGDQVQVVLEPHKLEDPRFAYRVADVPAASHPTVAAALARLSVTHSLAPADDVVWDPFVGSGLELCERGLLARSRRLVGTDVSSEALAAARANLDAAGVAAELVTADALAHHVAGVTVILTNPPMGRRVLRGQAQPVLEGLLERAAALLPAGGLLCWISPVPGQTRARAAQLGLRLLDAHAVDMAGFAAEIQVLRAEKPPTGQGRPDGRTRGGGNPAQRPRAGSRAGATRSRRGRSA